LAAARLCFELRNLIAADNAAKATLTGVVNAIGQPPAKRFVTRPQLKTSFLWRYIHTRGRPTRQPYPFVRMQIKSLLPSATSHRWVGCCSISSQRSVSNKDRSLSPWPLKIARHPKRANVNASSSHFHLHLRLPSGCFDICIFLSFFFLFSH
jgi:hypothetical protein